MEPNTNNNSSAVWWIVGIIVVLIIGGWLLFRDKPATETVENVTEEVGGAASGVSRITIDDQYPGKVVYVSSVTLTKNGFVVIQKDVAGKAGAVIGSRYFKKGTNPGNIELSESTLEAGTYYAALYMDNDGDGIFNASKDTAFLDASGKPVMKMFRVSKDLPQVKG